MLKQATMVFDLLYIISEFQINQIEIGFFFSQQGWNKDTPPNPPLEFQPHSKNSEPFTCLIALKPSWTEKTATENSFLLASSSDGKLSLRPYHPLDEHHPDELFLLTYV